MTQTEKTALETELNGMVSLVPRARDSRATLPVEIQLPASNSPVWTLGHEFVGLVYKAADGGDNEAVLWLKSQGVR